MPQTGNFFWLIGITGFGIDTVFQVHGLVETLHIPSRKEFPVMKDIQAFFHFAGI